VKNHTLLREKSLCCFPPFFYFTGAITLNVICFMKSKNPKPLKDSIKSLRDIFRLKNSRKKKKKENRSKAVKDLFPKFAYSAQELSAFAFYIDTFTIMLKDSSVIKYQPDNAEKFRKWLIDNGIRNVNEKS
jgi:hypothetical protein